MRSKLLVGQSPWLEMAADDWTLAEPDTALNLLPISLDKHYGYNLGDLARYSPHDTTAFVAWGPEFLNFQRLEMMGELKKRGFKMPPLLHPNAVISPSAQFQENAWVQAQAVIGPQVEVGMNACIGMGVRLGAFSQLGKSVWIGEGSNLGAWVKVDAHAVIGQRIEVADRVRIGRQACIEVMQRIERDWPEKSFHIQASGLQGCITELKKDRPLSAS
jgi:acyl-[acyl carrier protein]--UDP-N-acetylglucosamine O-acyltransferase